MLSIDDFKLRRIVCEVRFPEAFLIFDRSGTVFQTLRREYPAVTQDQAAPTSIQMSSEDWVFTLELTQCRVTSKNLNSTRIEPFTAVCDYFFGLVIELLEIDSFSRVGLRSIYARPYESLAAAREELQSLDYVKALAKEPRFGEAEALKEIGFRWEGEQLGALVGIKAETAKIDATFPPEFEFSQSELHKELNFLTLDVDYYTVAFVEPSQWDAATWIPQAYRIVRKESTKLLTAL